MDSKIVRNIASLWREGSLPAFPLERTLGSCTQVLADAQKSGEIIASDPEGLKLVMSASLHGMAAFITSCMLPPEAALASVDTLVHHLLHGMRPR
ncbi:hypothetical protein [Streptomyces ureilyticus]|uniref:Tetracyclin repressor-like C-terminal domain-containing protein n=1 Tax=Streptomyces ureilyticus TaxID=1775131 RepID=A0ABX0E0B6_9ACTN|nr:hypothetical protein [Streptomyces ureilyticus]NGO44672.1 hypothetical protein [Streptomyces ureilyticus]